MFEQLVNKQLISVCFVTIENNRDRYRLDDTLVLRMAQAETYQLLVDQASQALRDVSDNDIHYEGGLLEGERIGLEAINQPDIPFPETGMLIQEIKEYWADDGTQKFLMGVIFSDLGQGHVLPILTGGTEAEVTNSKEFLTVIHEMGFPYEILCLN